ncbi:MAG: glutaredoxin 3 [Candidatus Tokpelaia sp. JSC188]|nr:MAG: glutaredoxin 3 [Candidatus Tokpelaia sp. JSC188]
MVDITIYTKPGCPYCTRAKKLLDGEGLQYKEILVVQDSDMRVEMLERSNGRNTFPQIFINTVHVGGCDDLYTFQKTGKLAGLLQGEK